MGKIEKFDKNFAVEKTIDETGISFFDVCGKPFFVSGVFHDGVFRRMPGKAAAEVSEAVKDMHTNTAGGSVHFKTDSKRIAIKCTMNYISNLANMPAIGVRGFDIYVNNVYYKSFVPPFETKDGYESAVDFANSGMKNVTINFPLYNNVSDLYVGLETGSKCLEYNPYTIEKPVVYYGSSITQGGCASRPGMSYQAIISRRLGCRYINLGFSGSAKGEPKMAEYIAGLDMSAFVLDYDHNAPNAQHLKNTHENFFRIIRDKNPDLPIIMICQHDKNLAEADLRRSIILDTYNNAKADGDENVYFVDGFEFFPNNDCTVDGCHPSDYGFSFMAEKIGGVLEKVLK